MIYNSIPLVLSPMAGVTDAPFRQIAIENGANYAVSEMITSQTQLWSSPKTQYRLKSDFLERPRIVQIMGASPEIIRQAINQCNELKYVDQIELNMGCPAKKVCNVLSGSALLQDEALVDEILKTCAKYSKKPLRLKTRLGFDHNHKNILTIAKMAEDNNIATLIIHGRTRSDFYNGSATYDMIAKVKQDITIPVFANGDITSPEIAKQVLEYTRCDGLYIGRAALGNPWLFAQIRSYLTTGSYQDLAVEVKIQIFLQHIRLIHQHYDEVLGYRFARKHIKWYAGQIELLSKHLSSVIVLEDTYMQYQYLLRLFNA